MSAQRTEPDSAAAGSRGTGTERADSGGGEVSIGGAARAAGSAASAGKAIHVRSARRRTVIRVSYTLFALLALWEIIGRYFVTGKLTFAPLSVVVTRMAELWTEENLAHDILVSYTELVLGLLVAGVAGVAIGGVLGASKNAREHFDPIVSALYATPLVALSPILILSFGIGIASKVAVIALLAIFPIIVNTTTGLRTADDGLVEAARSFTASPWQVFRHVRLPNAVPAIVAGFRLGVGRGITGIFVGEFFGASAGVGYLITVSAQTFDVPAIFAGVLILALSGVILTWLLNALERRVAKWRADA